jgi:hypothetical protein
VTRDLRICRALLVDHCLVSFDVFLQRFSGGDAAAGGGEEALRVLAPYLAHPPRGGYALVRTGDGEADVYGLGSDHLMINHAAGEQIADLIVEVARAAGWAILAVGCPACVTGTEMIGNLPDELRVSAIVVNSGAGLREAIRKS